MQFRAKTLDCIDFLGCYTFPLLNLFLSWVEILSINFYQLFLCGYQNYDDEFLSTLFFTQHICDYF
jgi:hypothetical protein